MKKLVTMIAISTAAFALGACSKPTDSASRQASYMSKHHNKRIYQYSVQENVFHEKNGTLTVNKPVSATIEGKTVFFLDETVTNTSKKARSVDSLTSLEIEAYQKDESGSQLVKLNDQSSPEDAFSAEDSNVDDYNKAVDIDNSHSNKILPGKSVHTLSEFGYRLNNSKNDVTLKLVDLQAPYSGQTVNPKKNSYTIKLSDITTNKFDVNAY